jgi:signal transduction histidine kinase
MSMREKNEKEIIDLISVLLNKNERSLSSYERNIHGNISPIVLLASRVLGKKEFAGVNAELIAEIKSYLDEVYDNLISLSHELYPSSLKMFGLIKAMTYYSQDVISKKTINIHFEDESRFEKSSPFSEDEEINIYRIYVDVLNWFLIILKYTEIKIKTSTDNKDFFHIEFFGNPEKAMLSETLDKIMSDHSINLKTIEARLMILDATAHEKSDWFSFVKISIPF